jgi:hypothetical protein
MASNFNIPPGVTQNMIPGNRPEDIRRDKLRKELAALIPNLEDWTDEQADKLADYVEQSIKSEMIETFIHYRVPNSKMRSYAAWDGQMVDIAAPVIVEVEVRGDQKVLWVNVDGVARLRIFRIQGELTIKHQADGRTE